jgi:hypothetical protein
MKRNIRSSTSDPIVIEVKEAKTRRGVIRSLIGSLAAYSASFMASRTALAAGCTGTQCPETPPPWTCITPCAGTCEGPNWPQVEYCYYQAYTFWHPQGGCCGSQPGTPIGTCWGPAGLCE